MHTAQRALFSILAQCETTHWESLATVAGHNHTVTGRSVTGDEPMKIK